MSTAVDGSGLVLLPVDQIMPSPFNPRRSADQAALEELAESLKQHGMLEPVAVRKSPYTDAAAPYELILGERRWRAARIAGLAEIPALVREADDRTLLTLALEENLQRSDLNPIERAQGFRRLAELGQTQAEIAKQVGISQPRVANTLRLLKLPDDVQERIASGELSAAHGETLVPLMEISPAVVGALATYAAEQSVPVARLQGEWPTEVHNAITGAKAGKDVYNAEFDWPVVCRACPYGAFRPHSSWGGTCLRPSHFDELQNAARAAKKAAKQQQEHQQREELRAKGVEVPADIQRMNWSSMARIASTPPAGCNESCECRGVALDGKEIITICKKPAHYRELEEAQAAANRERRWAQAEQRIAEARAVLSQADPAILAAIVCAPWLSLPRPDRLEAFLREVGLGALPVKDQYSQRYRDAAKEGLKGLSAARSMAIAAEAMIWEELGQWAYDPHWNTPVADAILALARPEGAQQADQQAEQPRLDHDPATEPVAELERCCRCGAALPADLFFTDGCTDDEFDWAHDPRGHVGIDDVVYCAECWPSVRRCKSCGCTDEAGCPEGCEWVEADLCSVCAVDREVDAALAVTDPSWQPTEGMVLISRKLPDLRYTVTAVWCSGEEITAINVELDGTVYGPIEMDEARAKFAPVLSAPVVGEEAVPA